MSSKFKDILRSYGKELAGSVKEDLQEQGLYFTEQLENSVSVIGKDIKDKVLSDIGEKYGEGAANMAGAVYDNVNEQIPYVVAGKMRSSMAASDEKRDEGRKIPENIERFVDIQYERDAKWNLLDVYRPKYTALEDKSALKEEETKETDNLPKLPVIVSIHGGSWVYGDKDAYQYYCMNLAQKGFAVVNFSYRLAPENKFPAALEDTNSVFEWLISNSIEYGLDTDNIFIVGDSAGGNLAGLYLCILTNPEYALKYDFTVPSGLKINAAALNCGAYEPTKFIEVKELMRGMIVEEDGKYSKDLLDVTDHMNPYFPPVYLMSCVGDFCLKHYKVMLKALEKYNIPHEAKIYGSEEEPLGHVFHLNFSSPVGEECNDAECSFFLKYKKQPFVF